LEKPLECLKLKDNAEEEPAKKWKKEYISSTTTNKSTLSLQIAAYDKSFEAAAADPFGGKKKENLENSILESIKNKKQLLTSAFIIQVIS
jgi:hypothetical protein